MKKYDRSKIMKRAWALKKEKGMELGQAIKMSWRIAKVEANKVVMPKTEISFKEAIKAIEAVNPFLNIVIDTNKNLAA